MGFNVCSERSHHRFSPQLEAADPPPQHHSPAGLGTGVCEGERVSSTGRPYVLRFMGLQRVGHNRATEHTAHTKLVFFFLQNILQEHGH